MQFCLIAERQAEKLWLSIFIVISLIWPEIVHEYTVSVTDVPSTRSLISSIMNDTLTLLAMLQAIFDAKFVHIGKSLLTKHAAGFHHHKPKFVAFSEMIGAFAFVLAVLWEKVAIS